MNVSKILANSFIILVFICMIGCDDKNADHDHSAEEFSHEDHGGEDHEDHDDGGSEGHQDVVNLTQSQLTQSGVVLEPLGGGNISTSIMLPAEVGLNQDRVLHVTARVAGVVSVVDGYLGHEVLVGEVLATLQSPDLGEAKIAYLQAVQANTIADAAHLRQVTIGENTAKLLGVLRESPLPDELREIANELRIGVNKGILLSAYAQMRAGAANYAREQELHVKGLVTDVSLLAAQELFNSAQAEYMSAFEDVEFAYQLNMQSSEQASMIALSDVQNAERRLHLLGLTQKHVDQIESEPDTDIAKYELTASMAGRIIEKHITPGEKIETDTSVYTIADLTSVWLNISIYGQYIDSIKEGQPVTVRDGERTAIGTVDYISAIMSEETRTIAARVVLDNAELSWKPGEFVTVQVETENAYAERVVPIDAVQSFEGTDVVFVQDEDGIEPVPVRIGRMNNDSVELLGDDIKIGTPVVVVNSFLMKAELGKSSAGHQH